MCPRQFRSQDVRATEKDSVEIYKCFRPGDIVAAEVVSACTVGKRSLAVFCMVYNSPSLLIVLLPGRYRLEMHGHTICQQQGTNLESFMRPARLVGYLLTDANSPIL
eukprot:Opistho-2@41649